MGVSQCPTGVANARLPCRDRARRGPPSLLLRAAPLLRRAAFCIPEARARCALSTGRRLSDSLAGASQRITEVAGKGEQARAEGKGAPQTCGSFEPSCPR